MPRLISLEINKKQTSNTYSTPNLHPNAVKLIEELNISTEEFARFSWVLEDISNYYLGVEVNLKRLYRGVGGGLFWGWELPKQLTEENIWLSEISPLDTNISLHNLPWDKIKSTSLLRLTRDVTDAIRNNSWDQIGSIYLFGETRSHKSLVIKALLNFARFYNTVAYLSIPLLQEVNFAASFEEQRRIINLAKEVAILAIDDLGDEMVTDYFRDSWLFKIISARSVNGLPTIIISNFNLEQLEVIESGPRPTPFTRIKAKQIIKQIKSAYAIIDVDKDSKPKSDSFRGKKEGLRR